jgi:hypothetical protein
MLPFINPFLAPPTHNEWFTHVVTKNHTQRAKVASYSPFYNDVIIQSLVLIMI